MVLLPSEYVTTVLLHRYCPTGTLGMVPDHPLAGAVVPDVLTA